MPVLTKQVRERPWFPHRILAVAERNAEGRLLCPTFEFFALAKAKEPDGLARITMLLTRLATYGFIRNTDLFKSIEGSEPLFEFRNVSSGCRLFCFQSQWRLDYHKRRY
jgi:hypothetical protein